MNPCIIVAGNLSDGFRFVGPFPSFDEAAEYAERWIDDATWVASLDLPAMETRASLARQSPSTLGDLMSLIAGPLPNATVGEDNDGQLVIYTDLRETAGGQLAAVELAD
jgi:hypothetical protein